MCVVCFQAYEYCHKALRQVNHTVPPKVVVDVFRHCAKACMVKRQFKKAELIIQYAVMYARWVKLNFEALEIKT